MEITLEREFAENVQDQMEIIGENQLTKEEAFCFLLALEISYSFHFHYITYHFKRVTKNADL